ncbi:MAG: kdsC [Ramlibacter sp.]|nr:kdsC [Ramlibacter sp.]
MKSGFGRAVDRLSIYLPIMLMGLLALGTYWLARNTPVFSAPAAEAAPTHEPDYFLRGFSVKSFDPGGRLQSEVRGAEARHFPDTDTLEIDQPRIRTYNLATGALTVASARRAISNGDGTQVQLIGDAVVTREAAAAAGQVRPQPKLEIRGEFLHAFLDVEQVRSNKPVRITRGNDRFDADSLEFDNLDRVMQLRGNVRGVLVPRAGGG